MKVSKRDPTPEVVMEYLFRQIPRTGRLVAKCTTTCSSVFGFEGWSCVYQAESESVDVIQREFQGHLRIRLKNCHAGIKTSRRIVLVRVRVPRRPMSSCVRFSVSPFSSCLWPNMLWPRRRSSVGRDVPAAKSGWLAYSLVGVSTTSTVSTSMLFSGLTDCRVFLRCRCRFTSILLLKYCSRQSSSLMALPSAGGGGIATSRSRSRTIL